MKTKLHQILCYIVLTAITISCVALCCSVVQVQQRVERLKDDYSLLASRVNRSHDTIAAIELITEPETVAITTEPETTEPITEVETTAPETTKPYTNFYWNVPLSHDLQDFLRDVCNHYGIDVELALAVIKHESNFNPNEVSPSRDYGLMQIHDGSFGYLEREFGQLDYLDPRDNMLAGVYILYLHISRANGDLLKGVMAYNKGDAGMRALWASGVHSTHYTERVFYYYELYLNERLSAER